MALNPELPFDLLDVNDEVPPFEVAWQPMDGGAGAAGVTSLGGLDAATAAAPLPVVKISEHLRSRLNGDG
jgi:hypothetical protein